MAVQTNIVVQQYRVHPHTGRIEVVVASVTTDENNSWMGPSKHYSVDPQALRDRWNNDLDQWETWVAGEHRAIVGHHPDLPAQLAEREGKVIG